MVVFCETRRGIGTELHLARGEGRNASWHSTRETLPSRRVYEITFSPRNPRSKANTGRMSSVFVCSACDAGDFTEQGTRNAKSIISSYLIQSLYPSLHVHFAQLRNARLFNV